MEETKSKKSLLIKTSATILTLLIILGGIYFIVDSVADSELEEIIQSIKDSGETLNFQDLTLAQIPDDENAAILLKQAFEKYVELDDPKENLVQFRELKTKSTLKMRQAAITLIEQNTETLNLIAQAVAKEKCNFGLDYSNPFLTELPITELSNLINLLETQLILAILEKKPEIAVQSISQTLKLADFLNDPILIFLLVKQSFIIRALDGVKFVTNEMELSEEHLFLLLKLIDKYNPCSEIYPVLIGERCFGHYGFDLLENGTTEEIEASVGESTMIPDSIIKLDHVFYLEYINKALKISTQPYLTIKKELDKLETTVFPWYANYSKIMIPAMTDVYRNSVYTKANLELAKAGLGLKIYQQKHGKYPAKLEDLIIDKIVETLPIDPFTDEPLVFKFLEGSGVLIYSVGADGIDDKGEKQKSRNEPGDIIWRYKN